MVHFIKFNIFRDRARYSVIKEFKESVIFFNTDKKKFHLHTGGFKNIVLSAFFGKEIANVNDFK